MMPLKNGSERLFLKSLHQGEFVESEEVRGRTEINPISKIPPPNPVNASAFYQRGEDYIQVIKTKTPACANNLLQVRWSAPAERTPCISGYQVQSSYRRT